MTTTSSLDPTLLTDREIALVQLLARAIVVARRVAKSDLDAVLESPRAFTQTKADRKTYKVKSAKEHLEAMLAQDNISEVPEPWATVIFERFLLEYQKGLAEHHGAAEEAVNTLTSGLASLGYAEGCPLPMFNAEVFSD